MAAHHGVLKPADMDAALMVGINIFISERFSEIMRLIIFTLSSLATDETAGVGEI